MSLNVSEWRVQAWEAVGVEVAELWQLRSSVAAVSWNHRVQLLLTAIQQCQQPRRTGTSLPSQESYRSAGSPADGVLLDQKAAEPSHSPCTPSNAAPALLFQSEPVKAPDTEASQPLSHQTTQTLVHLDSCASPEAFPSKLAPGQTQAPKIVSSPEKQSPPGEEPEKSWQSAAIVEAVVSQTAEQPETQSGCRKEQSDNATGAVHNPPSAVDWQLPPEGGATGLGHLPSANTKAAADLNDGASAEASTIFYFFCTSILDYMLSSKLADRARLSWQYGSL